MKKSFYAMAAALLTFASCSNEELMNEGIAQEGAIRATFEQGTPASRLAIGTDNNTLTWTNGDCFLLFGNGSSYPYSTTSEGATAVFTGAASADATFSGAAYPASAEYGAEGNPSFSDGTLTMTLPATLGQTTEGNCNLPMWASVTSLSENITFKHLAGVLKVNLSEIPVGYNKLTVTASNPISGTFTAEAPEDGSERVLSSSSTEEANKKVEVTFATATAEANDAVLYIPLPVGTYASIVATIANSSDETKTLVTWTNKTVERAKVYTASLTYQEVNASTPAEVTSALDNLSTTAPTVLDLTGTIETSTEANGATISVPSTAGSNLTLNFANIPTTTNGALNISSANETEVGEANKSLTINMPQAEDDATGANLVINTPTTTVTLASGSYEKVEATTATNTLIIGEGVTIGELVVNGGNVKLEGDLALSKPLVVNQNLDLDLGGNTLTTDETLDENNAYSAAVIVYAGTVNIKNGTIATSGENGHKKMAALWVRNSDEVTGEAQVTIEDGVTLKGNNWNETPTTGQTLECIATVYVSKSNGYVTINGGEFYCAQQEQEAGWNNILNYSDSFTTQNIVVNGGKFHGMSPAVGNGTETSYLGENALVAETGEGVFEVLSATNGTITLSEDMTVYSPLTINSGIYTLDLGGKTLTTAETLAEGAYSAAVIVYGGELTVKNGTITTSGAEAHKNMGAIWVRGTETAEVTIEDGAVLKGNNWNETAENQTECLATVYVSNSQGKVTIEGGEFYCVKQTQVEGQNQILNYTNTFTTQAIEVMGGTFYGMDPAKGNGTETAYLAEGYISTEEDKDGVKVYTVAKSASEGE